MIYLVVSCSFFFMSCARYYYAPNSVNIPLLSEREAKLNVQYAAGAISKGFECQSAFAITPHFAGMVNTMFGSSNYDTYEYSSGNTKTKFIEAGVGYFAPIKSTSLIFETYGGVGAGGVKNKYNENGNSKVNFTKLFVQPNIGVKVKGIEFGISSRMSWMNQKVVANTLSIDHPSYTDLESISSSKGSFLWEPGCVVRFGSQKFMGQLQFTGFSDLSVNSFPFEKEDFYFTIGFSIPIQYQAPSL